MHLLSKNPTACKYVQHEEAREGSLLLHSISLFTPLIPTHLLLPPPPPPTFPHLHSHPWTPSPSTPNEWLTYQRRWENQRRLPLQWLWPPLVVPLCWVVEQSHCWHCFHTDCSPTETVYAHQFGSNPIRSTSSSFLHIYYQEKSPPHPPSLTISLPLHMKHIRIIYQCFECHANMIPYQCQAGVQQHVFNMYSL